MKNYQKKFIILIFFGLLLNICSIHSQTSKEIDVYNLYDKTVGKENLDINNGILYTDPFRTSDGHIYYIDDKFEKGSLSYEGQIYYETALKYDVYRDILILNPHGNSDLLGISLIKEKVQSFTIYNQKFVNLNKEQFNLPNFTSGYYEVAENSNDFVFYIKYSKLMQKKVREDGIYYQFKPSSTYYLSYQKNLYKVDTKGEILKIFPDLKKQINEFYLMNRDIRKSDPNQFMKNLMKYINNSLSNQNK